jgi:hypothetical protein
MEYFSPSPTYPQKKLDCQLFQAGHDDPRFSRGDVHVREYTVHMYSSTLSILCDTVKTGSFFMFFRGLSKKNFPFQAPVGYRSRFATWNVLKWLSLERQVKEDS